VLASRSLWICYRGEYRAKEIGGAKDATPPRQLYIVLEEEKTPLNGNTLPIRKTDLTPNLTRCYIDQRHHDSSSITSPDPRSPVYPPKCSGTLPREFLGSLPVSIVSKHHSTILRAPNQNSQARLMRVQGAPIKKYARQMNPRGPILHFLSSVIECRT
jgi:hypothetical protein